MAIPSSSQNKNRRPAAKSGISASSRTTPPKQNPPTIVWILAAVAVLIIGAVVMINNSNETKARELAASKKKNEEIARKNAEIAKKAQEDRERRKREKEERMAAAAREAEEAAKQQQQTATTPEPEPTPTPQQNTVQDDSPDATSQDGEDVATDEENPGDEDEGEEEAEAEEEDAQPELKLTGKASKKNLMAFGEVIKSYTKEGDFEGLRTRLMEELTKSFPKQFSGEEVDIFTVKVKPTMGKRALTICRALDLAEESSGSQITSDESKFCTWLIGAKKSPALDFCTALEKHKVSRDMALDMMLELRAAYKENPKKAAQKARSIANPMFAGPSKKLYVRSKEDIENMLEEILTRTPSSGVNAQQQSAINMCNAFRYLCGVPPHVVFDKTYQKEAQEAAEACQKAGTISHDLGHFTDKCNLHMGTSDPTYSVKGYIEDSGDNNRERRGHRAWILNAGTQKTAFGVAGNFQAQRTLDNSFAPRPEGGYGYPGKGFFPTDYLLGTGWSYYCGSEFSISADTKVEVWMFHTSLKSVPTADQLKKATPIPVVATFPHGGASAPLGNSIVFEPDYSKFQTNKDGKKIGTYWVVISSGAKKIEYVVDLF